MSINNISNTIKDCTKEQLNVLCDRLRTTIYDTVMQCGGHLASNLGAVESTVALFHVFDFPNDKIVFIAGADKLCMKWMQREEFVRDFGYIVTNRGDIDCELEIAKSPTLSQYRNNIKVLTFDSDVSSTQVRNDINNTGTTTLVSESVLKYIKDNKLFA